MLACPLTSILVRVGGGAGGGGGAVAVMARQEVIATLRSSPPLDQEVPAKMPIKLEHPSE